MLFIHKTKSEAILVDVFNMNVDHEKMESAEKLQQFLQYRLETKRSDKRLDTALRGEKYNGAFLQPFLWVYDLDTIRNYKQVFANSKVEHTLPVLCLRQQADGSRQLFYDCVEINEIT